MPEITQFEHNGVTVNATEPPASMGALSDNIIGIVGTAPDRDASVPVNVPYRINSMAGVALLDTAGDERGTLYQACYQTLRKSACVIYVIVVEEGADDAETQAAVIGGVDATSGQPTGISALATCAEVPNLLGAPGFASEKAVIDALCSLAMRIRARVVVDGVEGAYQAVIDQSGELGGEGLGYERCYLVYQQCQVYSKAALGEIFVPPSTMALGCFAAVKPWESPGNQGVYIDGVLREVDYNIVDTTSTGDLLNRNGVSYYARTTMGGYSLIGNRSVSGKFISHVGLEDEIARKLCATAQKVMAKNLTIAFMQQELRRLDNWGQSLVADGVIPIFECYLHPTLNSAEKYNNGTWYIVLNYARYSPNEHMVYQLNASEDLQAEFVEAMLDG